MLFRELLLVTTDQWQAHQHGRSVRTCLWGAQKRFKGYLTESTRFEKAVAVCQRIMRESWVQAEAAKKWRCRRAGELPRDTWLKIFGFRDR